MAKDYDQFNPKGGNLIWVSEVNPTTYALITPVVPSTANKLTMTGMELGALVSSGHDSTTSESNEDFLMEDKELLRNYKTITEAPVTEGVMYERGALRRWFLRYRVKGRLYVQCHYQNIVDGFHDEEFSFGTITPQDNNSFPGGNAYRYKFNKVKATATRTLASVDKGLIQTAYDVIIRSAAVASSVVADEYEVVTSTAV